MVPGWKKHALQVQRIRPRLLHLLALALLPPACDNLTLDSKELTSRSDSEPERPRCDACHPYLLRDPDHIWHADIRGSDKVMNGPMTCLDCHLTAMASRAESFIDSILVDSTGLQWHTLGMPDTSWIRELDLVFFKADTFTHDKPVPGPVRPHGGKQEVREWLTGLAHMNGKVDVSFPRQIMDPVRFKGSPPEFSPTEETCSAMACHRHDGPYRFAAPSKGLTLLTGE